MPAAACVASGTVALKLALLGLGVKRGDKVLVPAYSCVALPNAVLACDAEPVAVDVTPGSWNIDAEKVASVFPKVRPKVIVGIHLFGMPFAVRSLMRHGVPVIEDCSHGFGAIGERTIMGSHSGTAITSLYATKYLGGVEGGAVISRVPQLVEFVRDYRDYTDKPPGKNRLNEKMSDLEATVVVERLRDLRKSAARRESAVARYDRALRGLSENGRRFRVPVFQTKRIWYRYAIDLKSLDAEEAIETLEKLGVGSASPVHDWVDDSKSFPVASHACEHLLSLPLYPSLRAAEQRRVIQAVAALCQKT